MCDPVNTTNNPSFTLSGVIGAVKIKGESAVFSLRKPHELPQVVHTSARYAGSLETGQPVTVVAHIEHHEAIGRIWRADSITKTTQQEVAA